MNMPPLPNSLPENAVYIVMGEASRLPLAVFDNAADFVLWLQSRRGVSMLRTFWTIPGGSHKIEELNTLYLATGGKSEIKTNM